VESASAKHPGLFTYSSTSSSQLLETPKQTYGFLLPFTLHGILRSQVFMG